MIHFFNDFISLLFPENCVACGRSLHQHEKCICMFCDFHLPKTNMHKIPDNKLDQLFWGRVSIQKASAYLQFVKGGKVQKLIHSLKYKGNQSVGEFLGETYGKEIVENSDFLVDLIIPVPLHPKKKRLRGYNQSECFGRGLSKSMNVSMDLDSLRRVKYTDTQTKKSRFMRWENMNEKFIVKNSQNICDKSILLIDDVITTGATLEACACVLLEAGAKSVSVVAIAYA